MILSMLVREITEVLTVSGSTTPRLDAEVIVAHVLQKDRAWLLAHPDYEIQRSLLLQIEKLQRRREAHEPIAYITGRQEFYGRMFRVSPDTLTPRPETETLVECALEVLNSSSNPIVIDVGTGSGCIAISTALGHSEALHIATDISHSALDIASKNIANYHAPVTLLQGNLLEPVFEMFVLSKKRFQPKPLKAIAEALALPHQLIILANLPYVPDSHTINAAAMQEPAMAIFGGADGLDVYRELFDQLDTYDGPVTVITESLPPQHTALAQLAHTHGFTQKQERDLIQVFITT